MAAALMGASGSRAIGSQVSDMDIGVVNPKSMLHFPEERGNKEFKRSNWALLDWVLGTQRGQFVGLAIVMLSILTLGALCWMATGGNGDYDTTWWSSLWFSWGMFFDPGTQMGFSQDEAHYIKVIAVIFSVMGFLYNLVFLGLIVDVVRNLLAYWRKSRGRIVANKHTLLLGWTNRSLFLIAQLFESFKNRGLSTEMVVLAEEDPFVIRQEIARHFGQTDRALMKRIHIRQGSPSECDELLRVSVQSAKEIVILSLAGPAEDVDLKTVRTMIAVAALPQPPECPVIAEVRAPETSQAVQSILTNAEGIYVKNAVRRALCMTAIQPAVGDTFQILMTWLEGAEIYVKSLKDLGLKKASTVGEAQQLIPKGIIIGVRPDKELCYMAPPDERKLLDTDKLLILADSLTDLLEPRVAKRAPAAVKQHKPAASDNPRVLPSTLSKADVCRSLPSRPMQRTTIMVGWSNDMSDLLLAFSEYLETGSRIIIMAQMEEEEQKSRLHLRELSKHMDIQHIKGNITSLSKLKELPFEEASAVVILADDNLDEDPRKADSACLQAAITIDRLISGKIKELRQAVPENRPRIVCEVLSPDTDRALLSSPTLGKDSQIQFFNSGMLEAGLFTMASCQTPVFNAILKLLQPNDYGDILSVPCRAYLESTAQYSEGIALKELVGKVRRCGDVLIGTVLEEGGSVQIRPHWDDPEIVPVASNIVVVTHRLDGIQRQMQAMGVAGGSARSH